MADKYNQLGFIESDPISIPHLFTRKEDIEIMAFFSAILAWGQRKTIIQKGKELIQLFDEEPFAFISGHSKAETRKLASFKHRTFNGQDLMFYVQFLKGVYHKGNGLEDSFFGGLEGEKRTVENGLNQFKRAIENFPGYQSRNGKHVSSPDRRSACKRLNMFLRWMVRSDKKGVDFGIWKAIAPAHLVCPCDVHVERVARLLGLIQSPKPNWEMAMELTQNLRKFDAKDPAKYDFALFGLGVEGIL